MTKPTVDFWAIVRCSYCADALAQTAEGAACASCNSTYARRDGGPLDLRLTRPKEVTLTFTIGEVPLTSEDLPFAPLRLRPDALTEFRGVSIPKHFTPTLLSHMPKASGPGSLALDLGCGDGVHRGLLEHAGYEYVGIDYFDPAAPILADGHALPFADCSFDLIINMAVLEHIRYPFVMMAEALRVLKPGGRIVGTVSFLEPFHMDSHYHHTHLGTLNTLRHAGFEVEAVAPQAEWMVLAALAEMSFFPKMPSRLRPLMVLPLELVHRVWWRLAGLVTSKASNEVRIRNTTGAFTFIGSRPAATDA